MGTEKDFRPKQRWDALSGTKPIEIGPPAIAIALYDPREGWLFDGTPDVLYGPSGFVGESINERYAARSGLLATLVGPLEFDVFISTPDPVDAVNKSRERDAWSMRDEFLNLPKSNRALGSFLQKWGHWDFAHMRRLNQPLRDLKDVSWFVHYVIPELVWEQQDFYKQALSGDMRSWIAQRGRMPSPQASPTPPFLAITDHHCVPAIETTITMDKMRDIPFRICQRPNCEKLFELTSKRTRLYCSYDCAHAEAVRRGRDAKKKPKDKQVRRK